VRSAILPTAWLLVFRSIEDTLSRLFIVSKDPCSCYDAEDCRLL